MHTVHYRMRISRNLGNFARFWACVSRISVSHFTILGRLVNKGVGLWLTVDQDGFVLDVLVQSRRNTKAANA